MKKYAVALMGSLGLAAGSAHAALPAGADAAITTAGADAAALGGVVLIAVIAIFAVKLIRRGL